MRNLTGHTGAVYTIEYISDGTVVTGAGDNNAIIWNPSTGTQLVSFSPFPKAIYAIREFSPQAIAICGYTGKVYFYKVNGSATPSLIKSLTPSASYGYFSMVVATVPYNGYNSSILYVSCAATNAIAFNVTNINSISIWQTATIDNSGNDIYSVEKSRIKLIFIFLLLRFLLFIDLKLFSL